MSIPSLHWPGRLGQRAIRVDHRLVEKRRRLGAPDPHARLVDRRLQRLDRRLVKPPAEIARRRRIGNPLRAQRIEIHLVLPAPLDILQARPATQHVVRDPEHVIRFVIRQMHLQHLHVPIDRGHQPRVLRQPMHRADPATRQSAHPITVLILHVARPIHRRRLRLPRPRPQPPLNSSFAPRHVLVSTCLHSKCPPASQSFWFGAVKLCYEVRTFRAFCLHAEPQTRLYWD